MWLEHVVLSFRRVTFQRARAGVFVAAAAARARRRARRGRPRGRSPSPSRRARPCDPPRTCRLRAGDAFTRDRGTGGVFEATFEATRSSGRARPVGEECARGDAGDALSCDSKPRPLRRTPADAFHPRGPTADDFFAFGGGAFFATGAFFGFGATYGSASVARGSRALVTTRARTFLGGGAFFAGAGALTFLVALGFAP